MKLNSWGRTARLSAVALVLWGCATAAPKPTETRASSGSNENQFCSWTFDRGHDGKIIAGSLQITNKAGASCTAFTSANKLYIGDAPNNVQEVLDIGAVDFVTKGSCRYCYLNTVDGMTCIVYPGPC